MSTSYRPSLKWTNVARPSRSVSTGGVVGDSRFPPLGATTTTASCNERFGSSTSRTTIESVPAVSIEDSRARSTTVTAVRPPACGPVPPPREVHAANGSKASKNCVRLKLDIWRRLWLPNAPVQLRAIGSICGPKVAIKRSEQAINRNDFRRSRARQLQRPLGSGRFIPHGKIRRRLGGEPCAYDLVSVRVVARGQAAVRVRGVGF